MNGSGEARPAETPPSAGSARVPRREPEGGAAASDRHEHGDAYLVEALRRGDESAYAALVERYAPAMLRFARIHTPDRALAEDAIQETWLGVLRGIGAFEGRSSLRTWVFRILLNRLRTRRERESRMIPYSSFFGPGGAEEPAVDPDRFLEPEHPRWPGHWRLPPRGWGESPEDRVLSAEVRARVDEAVGKLPPNQREVITLRDIEGWGSEEVCNVLGISPANQRVLLHRARARVRQALEDYLAG